jgi:hypothetical protein
MSTETKRSYTPWALAQVGIDALPVVIDDHGRDVAWVRAGESLAGNHYTSEQVEANARLLAAAPDLLDILVAWVALEPLIDAAPDLDAFEALGREYDALQERARQVVAKALGTA